MMGKLGQWCRRKDGSATKGECRQLGLHLIQTGVVAVIANAALETYLGKPGKFALLVSGFIVTVFGAIVWVKNWPNKEA